MLASSLILLLGIASAPASAADASVADASEKADWPRVRGLVKEAKDVNALQKDGMTALHWAAHHDHLETVTLLLAAKADAKAVNRYGVTPLSIACVNGNADIVQALLTAGADANAALRGGETVLMTAARTGRTGPVKALLKAGAKVDAKDRKEQTALMWAAADGHSAVVELLLQAGADKKARLKSGFTPMLFAVREGRIDAVKAFLKVGVDPNEAIETDRKGGGFAPVNGLGALGLAVENGHFELAGLLLKVGADANDQRSGLTAFHRLVHVRKPSRGDDPDGQPPPTGSGNMTSLQFVREMVKHGGDVNARLKGGAAGKGKLNLSGATPFLMASKTADLPYMKLLVELKADPLLSNKDGCTPLMAAAGIGTLAPTEEAGTEPEALAAVEYLLGLGAELNTVDANGETAMHGAAYKSLPKMVRLLDEKGSKIDVWNKKDKHGWTPLLIAEGFRPGNFKPSEETIAAIHAVMRSKGVSPPARTPPPVGGAGQAGYESGQPKK